MNISVGMRAPFLRGDTELGTLMRERDWSASPLGPPDGWPQPLKTLVPVMLGSKQPMFIAWGPERTLLYNDPYAEILADRHPVALGRDFLVVCDEIADDLRPIVDEAYAGRPVHMSHIRLELMRNGRLEDAHFAFSYTPVLDEQGVVGGFFCACSETTAQVLAERQQTAENTRQRRMFEQAPGFIAILRQPEHIFEFVNESYRALFGDRDFIGRSARSVFPDLEGQGFFELLDRVYETGERYVARHVAIRLQAPNGSTAERFLDFIYEPVTGETGTPIGIFCEGHDVTDAHLAQQRLNSWSLS